MTAQAILSELDQRGIALVVKGDKILSKPPIPADLLPALKENKAEIVRALKWRQNVEHLKKTFGAVELTGPELLKSEYNFHLAEIRRMEKLLDDKKIPLNQREAQIPEFQRLSRKLSELLNCIGGYYGQEAGEGFEI